MKFYKPSL